MSNNPVIIPKQKAGSQMGIDNSKKPDIINNFKRAGNLRKLAANLPYILAIIFLVMFFYYPLFSILKTGFTENGNLSMEHFNKIFISGHYRNVILFTIKQAVLSACVTIAFGLPASYLLSKHQFRFKSVVKAVLTVPFVLPTITVAIGFIFFFGKNGPVNDLLAIFWVRQKLLYNLPAIIFAHVFFNFAIVVRLVGTAWTGLGRKAEEAAESLGAPPYKRFLYITLPLLAPAILASFILTFLYCFMSFTIVLVLGGPTLTTMEVEIFTLNRTLLDRELASAMAVVQLVFTLIFLYIYMWFSSRLPNIEENAELPVTPVKRKEKKNLKSKFHWKRLAFPKPVHFITIFYIMLVFLLILGPMLEVVRHSFLINEQGAEKYTLEWYREILRANSSPAGISPLDALINTLFFALMTVVISVPVGTTTAYLLHNKNFKGKNAVGALLMLPLGISAITLALGLIRGYSTGFLVLNRTWYGIVIAHSLLSYPFVMRSVSSSLKNLNPHLKEAAMSAGANKIVSFFRIELPLITPGILVGAIFAFSISVGELGATYMLYKPRYATLPMVIYRYIGSRNFGTGIALSVVLMFIVLVSFLTMEKIGKGSGF